MPDFSSFIPDLVLANMVLKARKNLVAAQFCNTTVGIALREKGEKLTINTLGEVTSSDTDETTPMTYGATGSTGSDLEITMDKTVSIKIKDKDKAQIEASGQQLESAYAGRMIYTLNDDVDQLVFSLHGEMVDFYETGTTPWQWGATAADVPAFFAALHKAMDDANCEKEGRFVALPNVGIQGIRLAVAGRATALGDSTMRDGMPLPGSVGTLFGMEIFQSPNCKTVSTTVHGIAGNMPNVGEGVPGCLALAVQIAPSIEKLRLEGYWADGLRSRVTGGAVTFKADRAFDVNLNTSLLA